MKKSQIFMVVAAFAFAAAGAIVSNAGAQQLQYYELSGAFCIISNNTCAGGGATCMASGSYIYKNAGCTITAKQP